MEIKRPSTGKGSLSQIRRYQQGKYSSVNSQPAQAPSNQFRNSQGASQVNAPNMNINQALHSGAIKTQAPSAQFRTSKGASRIYTPQQQEYLNRVSDTWIAQQKSNDRRSYISNINQLMNNKKTELRNIQYANPTKTGFEKRIQQLREKEAAYQQYESNVYSNLGLKAKENDGFIKRYAKSVGAFAASPYVTATGGFFPLMGGKVAAYGEAWLRNPKGAWQESKRAGKEVAKMYNPLTPEGLALYTVAAPGAILYGRSLYQARHSEPKIDSILKSKTERITQDDTTVSATSATGKLKVGKKVINFETKAADTFKDYSKITSVKGKQTILFKQGKNNKIVRIDRRGVSLPSQEESTSLFGIFSKSKYDNLPFYRSRTMDMVRSREIVNDPQTILSTGRSYSYKKGEPLGMGKESAKYYGFNKKVIEIEGVPKYETYIGRTRGKGIAAKLEFSPNPKIFASKKASLMGKTELRSISLEGKYFRNKPGSLIESGLLEAGGKLFKPLILKPLPIVVSRRDSRKSAVNNNSRLSIKNQFKDFTLTTPKTMSDTSLRYSSVTSERSTTKSITSQYPASLTRNELRTTSIPSMFIEEPIPLLPPLPPLITFPSLDFGKDYGRGIKLSGQRKRYTPSLIALDLRIRGKAPKRISGFEIRPLSSKRRRRR